MTVEMTWFRWSVNRTIFPVTRFYLFSLEFMMIVTAKRLAVKGDTNLRKCLVEAFSGLWALEGRKGIWAYDRGCKKDFVPTVEGEVVAETNGSTAVFRPDVATMDALRDLI